MINRAAVQSLGISAYTVCLAYESKYPDFSKEFLGVDFSSEMEVTGKGMLQYGTGSECDQVHFSWFVPPGGASIGTGIACICKWLNVTNTQTLIFTFGPLNEVG